MSLILALLFSLPSFAQKTPQMPEGFYFVNRCMIFDKTVTKVKHLPGDRCLFLDNGDFISSTATHIRYYGKNQEIKWELRGSFHHQLNWSQDRTKLLVMNSVVDAMKGEEKKRYDELMIVNLEGNVLRRAVATSYLEQKKLKALTNPNILDAAVLGVTTEGTHFNSFYEIPPMEAGVKVPEFVRPGHYIVNGNFSGFMVIDPTLKTVVQFIPGPNKFVHNAHDAQVTAKGKLLYFHNIATGANFNNLHSTINEYDFSTGKTEVLFKANPESVFYSEVCGGVQDFGDLIMFSHYYAGTFVYSRKWKKVLWSTYALHRDGFRFVPTQEIKIHNLSKFMSSRN